MLALFELRPTTQARQFRQINEDESSKAGC
jgi:hypothetical protein